MAERLPYLRKHFRSNEAYMEYWLVAMGFVGSFGLGLIEGNLGGGKSLFGYTIAWWVKHLFGTKITVDQMPSPPFGEYTYFEVPADLLREKELVDKIATRGDVWEGPEVPHLKLYKRFVFIDEFYKIAYKRRGQTNLMLEFSEIIKQARHMDTFILCAMPHKREVDVTAVDDYIDVDIRAAWSMIKPDTANYIVYNRKTLIESVFTIYGPNYYPLYNSKNPIRARRNIDPKEYKKHKARLEGKEEEEEKEKQYVKR